MSLDLALVLKNHRRWLDNPETGKCADLPHADLRYADLRGADLRGANLCGANLCGANLSGANLCDADLSGANLSGAYLRGANLCDADLRGANLSGANLPYPVYQFFIGTYNAVATIHKLRIGCEVHNWETWLNTHRDIGAKARLSEAKIIEHGEMIHLMYKLIAAKTKED